MKFADLPALGQPLDAGIFCGVTTTQAGRHAAIVLLANRPNKRLTWKKAMAWAEEAHGVLPSRPVSATLFMHAKAAIEPDWYWTCDEFDGSYAWGQYFGSGSQYYSRKSYEGRAVAVRLIQLEA